MSMLHDFHGGVLPPAGKRQSTAEPICSAGLPEELVLPLLQPGIDTLRPLVSVGQQVLKGEPIAVDEHTGTGLHASTSGTVTAIEPRPVADPDGAVAPCIVLRPDGADRWIPRQGSDDYRTMEREALLARIRAAGIRGLGGGAFPTATKLATALTGGIDTLIINGVECEPWVTADDLLMRERAAEVVGGAAILRHLLQPARTLIGVGDDKPEAIGALTAAADGDIEILAIPSRYPAGSEQLLILQLTGREVPGGGLPTDIGVLCQNVATAAAVFAAVVRGEPLLQRIVTVTGGACGRPRNYAALLGTPLAHLLSLSGYDASRCPQPLVGGPMTGFPLCDTAAPVTAATTAVLAATAEELPPRQPRACIRCGRCAEVCPLSLLPQELYRLARRDDQAALASHHLFDCIECGACDYICPSQLPLTETYRRAKADLLEREQDRVRAARARARFEAHQQRIARENAERDARRLARRAALAALPPEPIPATAAPVPAPRPMPEDRLAVIQAAVARSKARKAALGTQPPPSPAAAPAPTDDRLAVVQAAIARSRAKKAALQTQRPAIATLTDDPVQRLEAMRRRLANAERALQRVREQGLPKADEMEAQLAELRAQIAEAEAQLGNPPA